MAIEPALVEEMERLERAGQHHRPLPVILALAPSAFSEDDRDDLAAATERLRAIAADLVTRLRGRGMDGELRPLALARALAGSLVPAAIRAVAEGAHVSRVVWDRPARVEI